MARIMAAGKVIRVTKKAQERLQNPFARTRPNPGFNGDDSFKGKAAQD